MALFKYSFTSSATTSRRQSTDQMEQSTYSDESSADVNLEETPSKEAMRRPGHRRTTKPV